jgi:hypothetical protein
MVALHPRARGVRAAAGVVFRGHRKGPLTEVGRVMGDQENRQTSEVDLNTAVTDGKPVVRTDGGWFGLREA